MATSSSNKRQKEKAYGTTTEKARQRQRRKLNQRPFVKLKVGSLIVPQR
jgi:hypothetical protein